MVLAFAGHRPEKLPWGTDESDLRCMALKTQIGSAVAEAADRGFDTFLCGMARGCDFWFAEAVLALKRDNPGVRLYAFLPCPSQPDRWPEPDKVRYEQLLLECDGVYMVEQSYSDGCMLRRKRRNRRCHPLRPNAEETGQRFMAVSRGSSRNPESCRRERNP